MPESSSKQTGAPMSSEPLIVTPSSPPCPEFSASRRTKLLLTSAALCCVLLYVAALVLPSFALRATDHAWATANGLEGTQISLGWKEGTVKGLALVDLGPAGHVWARAEGETLGIGISTPGWKAVFRTGSYLGGMIVLALASPLFLFVCVPFGWKLARGGEPGWTDGCGVTVCVATQAIWLGLGAGVLAASLLFVSRAEDAVAGLQSHAVVCDGEVTCGSSRDYAACGECRFEKTLKCGDDECTVERVQDEGDAGLAVEISKAVWLLVVEGALLMSVGVAMAGAFCWVVCVRMGKKGEEGVV